MGAGYRFASGRRAGKVHRNPLTDIVPTLLLLGVMMLFAAAIAAAQITITTSDVGAIFQPGSTVTSYIDSATRSVDIGAPGSTSWDYTSIHSSYASSFTVVNADTTPFSGYFPGAGYCQRFSTGAGWLYTYMTLTGDLDFLGTGTTGFFTSRSMYSPAEVIYHLPMTYGTSWTTSDIDSVYTILPPPLPVTVSVSTVSITNSVDAYGSLKLPGGAVYPALRLKSVRTITTTHTTTRFLSYSILAANGAMATIVPSDTLQPDHGVITVSSLTWNRPVVTAVESSAPVPPEFELRQNQPNPFNPATTLRFEIRDSKFVSLRIYDVLGREAATLVNEMKQPGPYAVEWNAGQFPSGVYFCTMQAGIFSQTRKLLLVR